MISEQEPLVLGSASPRRRDLLAALGIPIVVRAAEVDESPFPAEVADRYVSRVTQMKLAAVLDRGAESSGPVVLVADTTVTIEGQILGKPRDRQDAIELLQQIVGRSHQVLTCYAISAGRGADRCQRTRTVRTEVTMRAADPETLRRYVATGEGMDKAGAYAIQGIGSFLVQSIAGSHSNVIGLPVAEVVSDLVELGALPHFP